MLLNRSTSFSPKVVLSSKAHKHSIVLSLTIRFQHRLRMLSRLIRSIGLSEIHPAMFLYSRDMAQVGVLEELVEAHKY